MEKSHKIYNLIFDFLLAAGGCFYNDLRFMRFWFLGGQLYHSVYKLPLRPNGQGGLLGFFAAEHSALPAGV